MRSPLTFIFAWTWVLTLVNAVSLDLNSNLSICAALKPIQEGMWNYYLGFQYGGAVGTFVPPYYWWNAGEAFSGFVDYYTFCDSSNLTLESWIFDGMISQAGPNLDYVPANQSMVEGNDDQGIWGMAILQALEQNFTQPEEASWLELAQAIHNTMDARWDNLTCNGGLRWQIFSWNSGYDYKNSISNGCLFHIAARLAKYTGNDTYVAVAEKVWDWMDEVNFFTEENGAYIIYDGAKIANNCGVVTTTKWLYSYGIFMAGAAYMYNYTGDTKWLARAEEILTALEFFFNDTSTGLIMTEMLCAAASRCNNDQRTFRSILARCLGMTAKLAPATYDVIKKMIDPSSMAAAQLCSGGSDGVTCGFNWAVDGWDGMYGLGEQMLALEAIQAHLVMNQKSPPLTINNGGTNRTNPSAGLSGTNTTNTKLITVTGGDKAGAGVVTAIVLALWVSGAVWLVL